MLNSITPALTSPAMAPRHPNLGWTPGDDPDENLRQMARYLHNSGMVPAVQGNVLEMLSKTAPFQSPHSETILKELAAKAKDPEGWPALVPITDARPQVPAFALKTLIPESLSSFQVYIATMAEHLQVPQDMIVLLALAAVSMASAGAYQIKVAEGWTQHATLMVLILAESGERKSAIFTRVLDPVSLWQTEQATRLEPVLRAYNHKRAVLTKTIERCISKIADPFADQEDKILARQELTKAEGTLLTMPLIEIPTLTASDSTPEGLTRVLATNPDHRVGIFSDEGEFVEILGGRYSKNPSVERFCKATDGMAISVNRSKGPPVSIKLPLVSGCIFGQPIVAARLIEDQLAFEKGAAARFIPCWPESRVGYRTTTPTPIPPAVESWWVAQVTRLLNTERPGSIMVDAKDKEILVLSTAKPTTITLSEDATTVFQAWRERLEPRLRPGVGDLSTVGAWGKKLTTYIVRIALLLHLLQDEPGDAVSVEVMNAAIAWENFIIGHCQALLTKRSLPKTLRVIGWIRDLGLTEFTKRDLLQRMRSKNATTNADWEPVIASLIAAGYIRQRPAETGKPGRPSEVYEVRPGVFDG